MPQASYPYAVGRIRVLENKLLSKEKVERMIEADTPADVLKILAESEYGTGQELASAHDYEKLLAAELRKVYDFIEEVTPDKELTDLFWLQYDIHNLKVLLKARAIGGGDEPLMDTGSIVSDSLKAAVYKGDHSDVPPFVSEVLREIDEKYGERFDPHRIEVALDKAGYKRIFDVLSRKKNAFLQEFFQKRVDLINIKMLLRAKGLGEDAGFLSGMLIPGGTIADELLIKAFDEPVDKLVYALKDSEYAQVVTLGVRAFERDSSLTVYERLADDFLLHFVKSRSFDPLGFEAIAGYIMAKENEIKLVRLIMVGKINNISTDKIRERLRDVYV